jgi:hypothetical protein
MLILLDVHELVGYGLDQCLDGQGLIEVQRVRVWLLLVLGYGSLDRGVWGQRKIVTVSVSKSITSLAMISEIVRAGDASILLVIVICP